MTRTNWAGNLTYRATRLHRPTTLEELAEITSEARSLRVIGSRHSFNDIADADEQVALDRLPSEIVVDRRAGTVSCGAWLTYGQLAVALGGEGLALANLGSLPHISIAGAIATGTHGSGDANGNLATSVRGLQILTSDGDLVTRRRGDAGFDGLVVGLGALGVVVRVELDVEPAYEVRQRVFEALSWASLTEHFDAITASGYSVSIFSRWGAATEQVWIKSRADEDDRLGADLFDAPAATLDRHPIIGLDPVHATPQLGRPGPWSERLPHFRMGFIPSSGDELQAEYLLPRRHARAAIEAMLTLSEVVHPLLQVAEIRTVAADRLWMSPAYGHDVVAFHFTWVPDEAAVGEALTAIEQALAPFEARPHWGKLFRMSGDAIRALYPRSDAFRALCAEWDPRGVFRNPWHSRVFGE